MPNVGIGAVNDSYIAETVVVNGFGQTNVLTQTG